MTHPPTQTASPALPLLGLGSEARIRALGDLVPDGLFTTDLEGTITFWNRAAEEVTGWSRAEAVGRRCTLFAGDLENGCACGGGPLRCDLARTGKSSKQCAIRTRDGRVLVIVKNAVPLLGDRGEPLGAVESFAAVGPVESACEAPYARGDVAGRYVGLLGRHPVMLELFRMIELVARARSPVLLLGESGAGKDAVAGAIHRLGPRAAGPLVRVACAGLDEAGLERAIAEAEGGALLLDALGDLPAAPQARLLRVVEDGTVERGGVRTSVDVRFLSTALEDLRPLVAAGRLRPDLFFRLAAFPLRVPPLREHASDVGELALAALARLPGRPHLAADAVCALEAHGWPGNVRELFHVIELAALAAQGAAELRREHLPAALRLVPEPPPAAARAPEEERAALEAALAAAGGNRTRAARALGISRVTLWKRMKRLGLAAAVCATELGELAGLVGGP
ncbi:MAG: sigma 54-interacting transcriptional regulator [Anaeromyxobacteraceae bacterium]